MTCEAPQFRQRVWRPSPQDVSEAGVTLYGPSGQRKWKSDPYEIGPNDSEAVRAWKRRMATAEAREIYKERGATVETVNPRFPKEIKEGVATPKKEIDLIQQRLSVATFPLSLRNPSEQLRAVPPRSAAE